MKHDALIAPDESQFAFTSKISTAPTFASSEGAADFVTVPDAHLLFNGDFKRSGDDLKIIGDDGNAFVVTDYFKHDKRPTLLSPEGAALTDAVVEALAGPLAPGQYAQAGAQPGAGQAIGRVEKVEGNATVVRNGVTITLNTGDVIMKGDVAQTGAGGSLAIVFADGTAFNLAANARMVLNDFVYSAGGGNNSALFSLVQGSISFVAGQVAKTGDMRVDTPVATMGIRGTAVLVEISANDGQTKFSVMVEPNGEVGSFTLYDKSTGAVLGTVNNSTIGWVVTPAGPLQVIAQQVQKSPAELARELAIVQQVFQTFNAPPFDPNAPQQPTDPNKRGDNPQGTQTAGSSTPPPSEPLKVTFTPVGGSTPGGNNAPGNPINTGDPIDTGTTGPGDTPTIVEQTITPPALNPITGSGFIFGTAGADQITGSNDVDTIDAMAGNDLVFAFGGNDIIVAGHGEGDDYYDGGTNSEEGDTIRFESTTLGVIIDLDVVNGVLTATADSDETGHDIIVNIENFVGGSGNDVFVLHTDTHWTLDGGGGFDTVQLVDGLDFTGDDDGPTVYNIEMVDLDDGETNVVDFDGDGVEDFNEAGVIRVIGNAGDVINLNDEGGNPNGRWVLVGNPQIDTAGNEGLFSGDHHTDGVEFQRYDFVEDGHVTSTAYVDTDILVNGGEPAAQDDAAGMTENQVLFVDALANDSDGGSAPATLTSLGTIIIVTPDGVTLGSPAIVIEDNKIRITPGTAFDALAEGETATITIPYTMKNGAGEMASAVATVTVTGTNDAPYFSTLPQGFELIGSVDDTSSFGGTPAVQLLTQGASASQIETFLGLDAGALLLISNQDTQPEALRQPTDGAAIAFDLELAAGETVTFTWNFASTEYQPFSDFAFFSFAPAFGDKLADIFAIGDGVDDGVLHSSGWQQYSFTSEDAGEYRLGIGVVNTDDTAFDSFLYISGFSGLGFVRQTTEDGGVETFDLLNGALDVDTNDILVARNIAGTAHNQDGESVDATGAIQIVGNTVTIDPSFFGYLASGESVTVTVNYDIWDGHAAAHNSATLVVAGANDNGGNEAPVINAENIYTAPVPGTDFDTTVFDISVSDAGAGSEEIYLVTATAGHGTLTLGSNDFDDLDDNAETLSFQVSLEDVNAAFASGVIYSPFDNSPGDNGESPYPSTDSVTLTVEDQFGAKDTLTFVFNATGEASAALSGTQGKDVIFASGHDDVMIGHGGQDIFVFSFDEIQIGSNTNDDVINDFHIAADGDMDRIMLDGVPAEYASFELLKPHISNDGGTAIIDLGEYGTIELANVAAESLQPSNFVFNPYLN